MESIKVIHETWGEGHVLPTTEQFDDEGNVYVDVMFEHGIEQEVMVDEGLGDFIRGAAKVAGRIAAAPGRIKTAARNFGQSVGAAYQSGKTAHEPKPASYPLQNKKQAAKKAAPAKKRTRVMGEDYELEEEDYDLEEGRNPGKKSTFTAGSGTTLGYKGKKYRTDAKAIKAVKRNVKKTQYDDNGFPIGGHQRLELHRYGKDTWPHNQYEEYELEEGRGGDEGPEHPVMALRKASTSMSGSHPVTFADGSTHDIPKNVAAKALRKHGFVRSQDKADLERQMGASRSSLMKAIGEEYELEEAKSLTAGMKLISTHKSESDDGREAKVYHDHEWDDYQVHHYKNGKHLGEGPVSYHGGGKEGKKEAQETAAYVMKPMDEETKLSPAQKKLASLAGDKTKIGADDLKAARDGKMKSKDVKEEVELDETSKPSTSYADASAKREASRQRAIKRARQQYAQHGDLDRAIQDNDLFKKDAVAIKEHVEPKISVDTEALRYRAVESAIRDVMNQNLDLRQIALEKKFKGE